MPMDVCVCVCVCVRVRVCVRIPLYLRIYTVDFNRVGLIFYDSPIRFCFMLNFRFSKNLFLIFFNDRTRIF